MNIFCTSRCPVESALWLDDLRVNKMIVESAQMLSTNIRLACDDRSLTDGLYKISFKNHPCTVWARQSRSNFNWLVNHALALCAIYEHNTIRDHKTLAVIKQCDELRMFIPDVLKQTEFANCTPFKGPLFADSDVIILYRMFMKRKWGDDIRRPAWVNRKQPEWSK